MNVYILMGGERNEGGGIFGVFAKEADALAAMVRHILVYTIPGEKWERKEAFPYMEYMEMGCEWLGIRSYKVQ